MGMLHRMVRLRSSLLSVHDQSFLTFSVFASHTKVTLNALKQLFKAGSCKQTLVDLLPSYLQLQESFNSFTAHLRLDGDIIAESRQGLVNCRIA